IHSGSFVTVIGKVGTGKSSLLLGICSQMPITSGDGYIHGKIGYVSQKPYIMDDSFHENVLMGAEYDEELYKQVIEASALTEDVDQLIDGDLTEIGANGINLSGGQKVRLALARALYLQADIYVLDDILSAVDSHVEHHIVEHVLAPGGIIGDKTRILVTHANHVVPLSDMVITLDSGKADIVIQEPTELIPSRMVMAEAEMAFDVDDNQPTENSMEGLNDLRSKISIIPQDPVLLEGTIRDNLDPAGEFTDDEVWEAINKVKIAGLLDKPTREFVDDPDDMDPQNGPWVEGVGLDKWVDANGINFSVGQRQLLNLCRALLWKRKIVVLDEATANVDSETDGIMQQVIREAFKDCTVLTIAHRLNTIMDSDRVLVIDQGQVAEFDTPENLMANKDSHFTKLVVSMKLNHSQLSGN
ncbi:hypothetical protein GGI07_004714, partial [Coemansia sp. Benny D115]